VPQITPYLLPALDLCAQNHSDAFGEGLQALGASISGLLQRADILGGGDIGGDRRDGNIPWQ
jgi:hypothetical protein